MKGSDQDQTHEPNGQSMCVDDVCLQAVDEILYKLSMLKRERIKLINLAHERTRSNLPLNSPELLAQANKINELLEDEAIRELFLFLRQSAWAQNRMDALEFKQPSLILASLNESRWLPLAREEFRMFQQERLHRLLIGLKP